MRSSQDNHLCIHPALTSFADECCATLAQLIVYVGALALFAIAGLHFWNQLQFGTAASSAARAGFTLAARSRPGFAAGSLDPLENSESYEVFRHPACSRKNVFHWGPPNERPVAELEIYRPGGEFEPSLPRTANLAARIAGGDRRELEAAGVIASKFGNVALFRDSGRFDPAKSCLGFLKQFGDPALQVSGWSCQGATLTARRASIGCMLDRLTLLASGNDRTLAELFARAELNHRGCGRASAAIAADWGTGAENPRLRGPL
ncbi:hypothetical protein [Bradyrhizobium sp.]|uniref:hypothetical protein n=1 Tax=Bradyrhizobium sp. TaxID=376 RepID=UPI002629492E|nr:hypothetical protein [Bradyrhizobium sp.]